MKELKTYIFEGFFNNVGANNIVKPVIDTIKDASLNDKINSHDKMRVFTDLLASTLKDIETDIKKGKLVFEYIRNDSGHIAHKVTITLKITDANAAKRTYRKWTYSSVIGEFRRDADDIAFDIADDLYYGIKYPAQDPNLRHSIANTIKVTEFKLS